MTIGGQNGTFKYSDEFILNLWNTGKTIKTLKQEYQMNYNNLSERLKALGVSKEEINQRAYSDYSDKKKRVAQYTLKGEYIQTFPSISAAAKEINSNTSNISGVCTGRRKSCKGYIWKYIE